MTVIFGELNFQSKHDLIGSTAKVKAAMFYTQYRKRYPSPFQCIDVSTAFGK